MDIVPGVASEHEQADRAPAEAATEQSTESAWRASDEFLRARRMAAVGLLGLFFLWGAGGALFLRQQSHARGDVDEARVRHEHAAARLTERESEHGRRRDALADVEKRLDSEAASFSPNQELLNNYRERVARQQADLDAARNDVAEARRASENALAAHVDAVRRLRRISELALPLLVVSATIAGVGAWLVVLYVVEKRRAFENRTALESVTTAARAQESVEAQGRRPLDLEVLWEGNRVRLEGYHRLVTNYAASTRQLTLVVVTAGFGFLLVVAAIAAWTDATASAIATSVVGAAGAALTSFVAQAVLRNAELSSKEVLAFFSHPLEVERFLTAERLVQSMPKPERSAAKTVIISGLAGVRAPSTAVRSDGST